MRQTHRTLPNTPIITLPNDFTFKAKGIIDFDNVKDNGDYTNPKQLASGIDYSIINGNIVIEEGEATPNNAGKVLRFEGR